MKLSHRLAVHFKMYSGKTPLDRHYNRYPLKATKSDYRLLKKLESMNLITGLSPYSSEVQYHVRNLTDLSVYRNSCMYYNSKTKTKVVNQLVRNDPLVKVILSNSERGLITDSEASESNLGGVVVALVRLQRNE